MTNPFKKESPPVVIVKNERPPGILDYACACGCGIPLALFILGLILNGLGFGG